jgi:hypothetical protein
MHTPQTAAREAGGEGGARVSYSSSLTLEGSRTPHYIY